MPVKVKDAIKHVEAAGLGRSLAPAAAIASTVTPTGPVW